ncbi:MAG: hypothetical protein J6V33_01920, partial [Bacteroidales bacterium]|nr:hypothetical protein [Bacteroidales bacterium]
CLIDSYLINEIKNGTIPMVSSVFFCSYQRVEIQYNSHTKNNYYKIAIDKIMVRETTHNYTIVQT